MTRKQRTSGLIAAAVIGVCGAAGALAEDVFVKLPTAKVLAGKGPAYATLVPLKKGDKLQVIGREGGWYKVKAGEQEGYIFQNSISTTAVSAASSGSSFLGSSEAKPAEATAAARGVESTEWAKASGMNQNGLNRMLALRTQVAAPELDQFMGQGKVGPR
jgi:hypothetical protein